MARLKQAAQNAGLPFADRKMTYNSRMAQELAKWAESKGKENEFHKAVFQAYFVQGLNIGKMTTLTALADSIELSAEEAEEVLRKKVFKEAVDADWVRSRHLGIQAVPTLVLDQCTLVGAQPYEKIAALLDAAGVRKRKEEK